MLFLKFYSRPPKPLSLYSENKNDRGGGKGKLKEKPETVHNFNFEMIYNLEIKVDSLLK